MSEAKQELLEEIAGYYSDRLARHGQTAAGVDWKDQQGQELRFTQLLKLVEERRQYSLCDLGCGYGALLDYVRSLGHYVDYIGTDVSADMVEVARARFAGWEAARFLQGTQPDRTVDFSVASGIFNVKLGRSVAEWEAYMLATLDIMFEASQQGFSFNCLTSYSDADKMRPDLYYADPLKLFDMCKRRYSRHVALLHDYPLYEFTLIVRRQA